MKPPTPPLNIGARVDDIDWERLLDGVGVIYSVSNLKRCTVHSIKHVVFPASEGVIVKYCLNLSLMMDPVRQYGVTISLSSFLFAHSNALKRPIHIGR